MKYIFIIPFFLLLLLAIPNLVAAQDTDGDGISNNIDNDDDNDGILDITEGNGTVDTDGDGIPNSLDLDSDNDGIPDNIEAQSTAGYKPPTGNDSDFDGLDDAYEPSGLPPYNSTGGGRPDYINDNTDGDFIPDIEENGDSDNTLSGNDSDNDGLDDNFDNNNDTWDPNNDISNPLPFNLGDEDGDVNPDGNNAIPITTDLDYRDLFDTDKDGIPDESCGIYGGASVIYASHNKQIYSINTLTGATVQETENTSLANDLNALASNPDKGLVYYAGGETDIYYWDPSEGNDSTAHHLLSDLSTFPEFHGTHLYSCGASYLDGIYYIGSETKVGFHVEDIFAVAMSEDGKSVLSVTELNIYEAAQAAGYDFDTDLGFGDLIVIKNGNSKILYGQTDNAPSVFWKYDFPSGIFTVINNNINWVQLGANSNGELYGSIDTLPDLYIIDPLTGTLGTKLVSTMPGPAPYVYDLTGPYNTPQCQRDIDDDNDGILDVDEGNGMIDTDGDGYPDSRDLDSDNDGIPDNIEAQANGTYIAPSGSDDDNDGLDNNYEGAGDEGLGIPQDLGDSDGINYLRDIDSDDDGIPDNIEGQATATYIPPTGNDSDFDGLDDAYDDAFNTGIVPINTDGADLPDYLDTNTDNTDLPDISENGLGTNFLSGVDTDEDGLDDNFDADNSSWNPNNNISDVTPATLGDEDSDLATDGNDAIPLLRDVDFRDVNSAFTEFNSSEICHDNGTSGDPTDDYYSFDVHLEGNNLASTYSIYPEAGYTSTPTSGTPGPGTTLFTFNIGSANAGSIQVDFVDNQPGGDTYSTTFSDLQTCSFDSNITDGVLSNDACDNNGTPTDPTDDFITFDLNPTGYNLAANYNVTVPAGYTVNPTSAAYGAATTFTLQSGSSGSGNVTITITDNQVGGDVQTETLTDSGTCSTDCTFLDTELTISLCDNNHTPMNPQDDTYSFSLNPNVANPGSNTYSISGDINISNIPYGFDIIINSDQFITNGTLQLTLIDDGYGCSINTTVVPPESCSDENSVIGIAKELISAISTQDSVFKLTFLLTIENFGHLNIIDYSVYDDIFAQFAGMNPTNFSAFPGNVEANDLWDGSDAVSIVAPGQILHPKETVSVYISFDAVPGTTNLVFNTAIVSATTEDGDIYTDESTDGTDPDSDGDYENNTTDNDNNPNENIPTPINFGIALAPPIAVNDTVNIYTNIPGFINTLANDTIDILDTIYITNQPSSGIAIINESNNSVQYIAHSVNCDEIRYDQFEYAICNAVGCDTATVFVTIYCDVIIYTAVSPNGDDINETFYIEEVDKFPNNHLYIYNRWGNLVFDKKSYQNSWDGTWFGKKLPDGSYYYIFDTGKDKVYHGYFELIR